MFAGHFSSINNQDHDRGWHGRLIIDMFQYNIDKIYPWNVHLYLRRGILETPYGFGISRNYCPITCIHQQQGIKVINKGNTISQILYKIVRLFINIWSITCKIYFNSMKNLWSLRKKRVDLSIISWQQKMKSCDWEKDL